MAYKINVCTFFIYLHHYKSFPYHQLRIIKPVSLHNLPGIEGNAQLCQTHEFGDHFGGYYYYFFRGETKFLSIALPSYQMTEKSNCLSGKQGVKNTVESPPPLKKRGKKEKDLILRLILITWISRVKLYSVWTHNILIIFVCLWWPYSCPA